MTPPVSEQLRRLPSVDEVLSRLAALEDRFPRHLILSETRRALEQARAQIRAGDGGGAQIEERVEENLHRLASPSLQRVINATGVVLHTNLGRAPLPDFEVARGYSNIEYDLASGHRGQRDVHISGLLERLTGAPGIAVNNNAAAIYLALNELACGAEVIVSRGELIEIGDGFRIPDIMARSGAVLREVGTTNRTRLDDYADAINERTRLLMRVHPSNFRMTGFTGRPELRELVALGRERGIPVYEDLGSGCVADLRKFGVDEPLVADSLQAGVNLVTFSGDKLLGGPQAGIIAGDATLVRQLRRNPMFRALRLDKLIYQALETTLRLLLFEQWNAIPALAMIAQTSDTLRERAEKFRQRLTRVKTELIPGESVIGGGSTPEQPLATWLIAITNRDPIKAERQCRAAHPPVITRIENDRLVIDLRTVFTRDEDDLAAVLQALS